MLDVLIIGSGPAGLSASVYAKRADLDVLVVEKEYLGTGQIAESICVDNYLGSAGKSGYELGETFREHALRFGVKFLEDEAKAFEKTRSGWKVYLKSKEALETCTVIYCAGTSHRALGVLGESAFMGKGVSVCAVCDGAFYQGKDTAVVGGGDAALDQAEYLAGICKTVYLIHRREEFRGSVITLERLRKKENVKFIIPAKVAQIRGENTVQSLILEDGRRFFVDGVFLAIGAQPQTDPVKNIVRLDQDGYIIADETGITTAEGFFAAGDVRTKRLRQVVTAVSDGANAAMSAADYIKMHKEDKT